MTHQFKKQASELRPTVKIFKVLMHPTRLSILEILREGEQCVCHIEAVLGYRQAYISQHLMALREAGLVEDRRDGTRIFYRVIRPQVFKLIEHANQLSGVKPMKIEAGKVSHCPCPKCSPSNNGNNIEEHSKHNGCCVND
jgi:DNA-binding transcriptional ArsR family regulator